MDAELDSFKRADLRAYAASEGYAIDRHQSSRGATVMRHINDDKIIVSRKPDGHFTYFSVRDDSDHGTIIDFVSKRHNLNLGEVRKHLRAWTGQPASSLLTLPALTPTTKDRSSVEARYEMMKFPVGPHPYLLRERKIPASVLEHWRFANSVKIDRHGNAVFPHFDADGLSGYELKNKDFTGFAVGGTKGLWLSKAIDEDRRLIVAESGIDAISHAALYPDELARYASISGNPNPNQPVLLQAQILAMPPGSAIVAAMDADEDGAKLAGIVRRVYEATGRQDLRFSVQEPNGAKDWNDLLRKKPQTALPLRAEVPSVA